MRSKQSTLTTQIKVGDTAATFVVALAQMNPQLKSLSFTVYSPEPAVHERLANSQNNSPASIVESFLHHDNRANQRFEILIEDITTERLKDKIANLPPYLALALDSNCIFRDGSRRYIPMMDFNPPPTPNNLQLLKEFFKRIACKGILVDSGASYHFYGFDFLDYEEWKKFLGKCLLAPWSDSRWVGHSLLADGGDLRISATERKPKLPSVCAIC